MTPGARVAAAIEILEDMAEGLAAEQALTRWARRSRFAGSKDRAAIRDHVFDVLRQRRTAAHLGQGETARALMIGMLRGQGADLEQLFTAQGHAPVPLSPAEQDAPTTQMQESVRWNLPDWLIPHFRTALGARAEATAMALQQRAPVFLRVNTGRITRADAQAALHAEGVETEENPLCESALTVTDGARRIRNSKTYLDGLIELQDAASQAVVASLPPGRRVLDFCAGGGGKSLALAAMPNREVFAHDIDVHRMADLPARAARAKSVITQLETSQVPQAAPFDIVLCDAPCSGSGAWRRAAEGKWTLTQARLAELTHMQDTILTDAAALAAPTGTLAYATCSVLRVENEDRVAAFLNRHPNWRLAHEKRLDVGPDGDGFYTAHLMRD